MVCLNVYHTKQNVSIPIHRENIHHALSHLISRLVTSLSGLWWHVCHQRNNRGRNKIKSAFWWVLLLKPTSQIKIRDHSVIVRNT